MNETPKPPSKPAKRCLTLDPVVDEALEQEARLGGFKSVPELIAAILRDRHIQRSMPSKK